MQRKLFVICFLLSSLTTVSQNLFKVIEVSRNELNELQEKRDSPVKHFRIVLNNDTSAINATYPFTFPKGIDTLRAIDELLRLEGDTRLCVFTINNYNPARSQIYSGDNVNYSIQVEALFLINQLVYEKPFNYSSFPMLVDKRIEQDDSVSGPVIANAFKAYRKWHKKVAKKGVEYIREKNIMPLSGSSIRWY